MVVHTDDVATTATNTDENIVTIKRDSGLGDSDLGYKMAEAIHEAEENLKEAEKQLCIAIMRHPEYSAHSVYGFVHALKHFYQKRLTDCGRLIGTTTLDIIDEVFIETQQVK